MVYSTYCNSYPRALMELELYAGNPDATILLEKYVRSSIFTNIHVHSVKLFRFEIPVINFQWTFLCCSCRIEQNLPELPLSAHLLAPIQRICRYPLHLSELVKHSPSKQELLCQLEYDDHQIDVDTLDSKETFEMALAAMKRVTEMVNEGTHRLVTCERWNRAHS